MLQKDCCFFTQVDAEAINFIKKIKKIMENT
jgi:hypothetical protein